MKGKIYFDAITGITLSSFRDNRFSYPELDAPFIEVEEEKWLKFLSQNSGKILKVLGEELTSEESPVDQGAIDNNEIVRLKRRLTATDWYSIRKQETGVDVPEEVLDERASARARINILQNKVS